MENITLIESFAEFKDDKLIDRSTLMAILEDVFRSTLKRKFGDDDNFDIIINPDKGDLEIWRNRIVVEDDKLEDENCEISLTEARKIEPDFEVGEDVSEEVKLVDLGRRSILALRQNLTAKIHEHDNTNVYKKFKDLEGEIYTAEVHHIRHKAIILLDDDGNEIIMPKDKQIPSDFFRKGDNIRGVIESVELIGTKPSIILSRTSPLFLEKLFEQEIPEIFDGLITIKKVVRIPGEKAKVAVDSYDDRIDPVGACVGMRGSRIQSIVRELNGEKIDIINWSDRPEVLISRAIAPAKPYDLYMDEEKPYAVAVFEDEDLAIAIGRNGHNIKLASQVTGYTIDSVKRSDYEINTKEDISLIDVEGISKSQAANFSDNGINTVSEFLKADNSKLLETKGIGEKSLLKISDIINNKDK